MAPETLIFMPNGDVTLTLIRNVMKDVDTPSRLSSVSSNISALGKSSSAVEQTPIDEDGRLEPAPGVEAEAPAEPEESTLYFAPDPPENEDGPFYPPPPRAARGSDASSRRDRSTSPPAAFWASLKRQAARMTEPSKDEQPVTPPKPAKKPERIVVSSHEVYCVVSSRHMMLASQYFQTILSGDFNEAITLRANGHVTIPLSADLDTMIILLNIVHGASRKVPRQVSLEVLSKLAVLVSDFGMLESVQFFSDTWIDSFQREGLPKSYNENVLLFLFVFWVFDRPSEFKNMTRLTQRECDEKLDEDVRDVPIPHNIINAIKRDREFAMETAITVIHALITKYLDGQTICDDALDDPSRYACDAMVLGSLMKSSRKIGVWPKPEAPFSGRKFTDLAGAIRSIRILDVCNKNGSRRFSSLGSSNNCHGLEDTIEASMESIEAGLDGLELSDYAKKGEDYNSGFQMFRLAPAVDELKEQMEEDTKTNFQIYMKEEIVEAPEVEVRVSQREHSVPEVRFSTRTDSREMEEPAQEEKVAPRQYSEARFWEEPVQEEEKVATRQHSEARSWEEPVQEEKVATRQYSEARFWEEPVQEEKVAPRQYSEARFWEEPVQEEEKVAPTQYSEARFWEEPAQEEEKVVPRQYSEARFWEEPAQEEEKVAPRQYSRDSHQPEARVSPSLSVQEVEEPAKEEGRANPRDSLSQEARVPARVIAKMVDEPPKEEVKVLADRKLKRITSFPKIPSDEIKSPVKELQVAPRVASIEEIIEEISHPEKEEVKRPTVEARETMNEALTATEEGEMLVPQNFKVRTSKKRFSKRF